MSNLTMYDTILNGQFPVGAEAYAAYVDGGIGNQPNFSYVEQAFPKAGHLSIAVSAQHDADALDVELGAAPPSAIPGWYSRQKARGVARPCLYANASTMAGFVLPVVAAARIPRAGVRLWSAHYDGEHICGPASCKYPGLTTGMDGTQWTSAAMGRTLDQSLLLGGFFTVPAPPQPKPPADWTYGPPERLEARGGHTTVELSWAAPAGAPVPPAGYIVFIYKGTTCSVRTLVKTYPRGPEAQPWEGGGLSRRTRYTAHVVAAGPDGTRVRPFTYASAGFTTS